MHLLIKETRGILAHELKTDVSLSRTKEGAWAEWSVRRCSEVRSV